METMKMMGSCNFQACSICGNPNQSIRVSYNNYKIPKSLSFSNSKPRRMCCSSSLSPSTPSSRFSYATQILKGLNESIFKGFDMSKYFHNFPNRFRNLYYDHMARQVLYVTVVLLDEDQQLKQKFNELVFKASNKRDSYAEANIVFDEVIPLLLKNADRWVSSRLMVSSNKKEALLKMFESEQMNTDKYMLQFNDEEVDIDVSSIEANALNAVRCTEVLMDVCTVGVTDVKLTEIHTRDDFKALLLHLMSMSGVMDASPSCFSVLVLKEKAKVLESYSHATT